MKTSGHSSEPAAPPKKKKDYGNLLCVLIFLSLLVASLQCRAWLDSAAWGCLAAACSLSPDLRGRNWKNPRELLAGLLVLAGVLLVFAQILEHLLSRH
jgi:hypothetical protein